MYGKNIAVDTWFRALSVRVYVCGCMNLVARVCLYQQTIVVCKDITSNVWRKYSRRHLVSGRGAITQMGKVATTQEQKDTKT